MCFCFGRYHILMESFFFSGEACGLMLILCVLDMKSSNINNCLCMLHSHSPNAKSWWQLWSHSTFIYHIIILWITRTTYSVRNTDNQRSYPYTPLKCLFSAQAFAEGKASKIKLLVKVNHKIAYCHGCGEMIRSQTLYTW